MNAQDTIEGLNEKAKDMTAEQIIKLAHKEFGKRLVFASSLGGEDPVISDFIFKNPFFFYLLIGCVPLKTLQAAAGHGLPAA